MSEEIQIVFWGFTQETRGPLIFKGVAQEKRGCTMYIGFFQSYAHTYNLRRRMTANAGGRLLLDRQALNMMQIT